MIKIQKRLNNPVSIIRAATECELSKYEKSRLIAVKDPIHLNSLFEVVRQDDEKISIKPNGEMIDYRAGDLSFKPIVDIGNSELFLNIARSVEK